MPLLTEEQRQKLIDKGYNPDRVERDLYRVSMASKKTTPEDRYMLTANFVSPRLPNTSSPLTEFAKAIPNALLSVGQSIATAPIRGLAAVADSESARRIMAGVLPFMRPYVAAAEVAESKGVDVSQKMYDLADIVSDVVDGWKKEPNKAARQPLNVYNPTTKEWFEGANASNVAYAAGSGIASMGAFILTGKVLGKLTGAAKYVQAGGRAALGADIGQMLGGYVYMNNELYNEFRASGLEAADANKLASAAALPIAISEYVGINYLGKIFSEPTKKAIVRQTVRETVKKYAADGFSREMLSDMAATTVKGFGNRLAHVAARTGEGMLVEGGEEYVQGKMQQLAEMFYDRAKGEEHFGTDIFSEQAIKDDINNAFWGGVIGGLFGFGGGVINTKVAEQSMFNYVATNINKPQRIEALKQQILKSAQMGNLTEEEAKKGVQLVDNMVAINTDEMPKSLTDPGARYQAYEFIGKRNTMQNELDDLNSGNVDPVLAEADATRKTMLEEGIGLYNQAIAKIAESKKTIPYDFIQAGMREIVDKYTPKQEENQEEDEEVQDQPAAEAQDQTGEETQGAQEGQQEIGVEPQVQTPEQPSLEDQRAAAEAAIADADAEIARLSTKRSKKAKEELRQMQERKRQAEADIARIDAEIAGGQAEEQVPEVELDEAQAKEIEQINTERQGLEEQKGVLTNLIESTKAAIERLGQSIQDLSTKNREKNGDKLNRQQLRLRDAEEDLSDYGQELSDIEAGIAELDERERGVREAAQRTAEENKRTGETKIEEDATEEGKKSEDNQQQYPEAQEGGQAAEAGRSDSDVESRQEPEEKEVEPALPTLSERERKLFNMGRKDRDGNTVKGAPLEYKPSRATRETDATIYYDNVVDFVKDIGVYDGALKPIWDYLADKKVAVEFRKRLRGKAYGTYRASVLPGETVSFNRRIVLEGQRFSLSTLVHEAVHTVIDVSGMRVNKALEGRMRKFQRDIKVFAAQNPDLVEQAYGSSDFEKRKAEFYLNVITSAGADQWQEVVTYALTEPEFAKFLQTMPSLQAGERGRADETLWDRLLNIIVDFVGDVTGMNRSALDDLTDILNSAPGMGSLAVSRSNASGQIEMFNRVPPGTGSERRQIEAAAKEDGSWLMAPNGQPSNLSGRDWVTVRTQAFKDWFGDWEKDPENASKVVDENGEPLAVYHGTTKNIEAFDKSKANVESNLGAGFYFTSSFEDMDANYHGGGADMEHKVQSRIEELANWYEDDEYGFREAYPEHASVLDGGQEDVVFEMIARGEYSVGNEVMYTVFLNMRNPLILDGNRSGTFIEGEYSYDEDSNIEETGGKLMDIYELVQQAASTYDDIDQTAVDNLLNEIMEATVDGGMYASDLERSIKEAFANAQDYEYGAGELLGSQIFKEVIEKAGFDGFIDKTVYSKFGAPRRFGQPMSGVNPDTAHYIAFEPNQIKSNDNTGTFSSEDERIMYNEAFEDNAEEREQIEEEAKANGTWLKAPNGKPTNLNPGQWVTVRTKAFKEWFGDWEIDPANASKVVDENGEPMVVYHGTNQDFDAFKKKKGNNGLRHYGWFFSTNPLLSELYSQAERAWGPPPFNKDYGSIMPVFLNIRDMREFDAQGKTYDEGAYNELMVDVGYDKKSGIMAIEALAGENGRRPQARVDGVKAKNIVEVSGLKDEKLIGDTYIVWYDSPQNIKSATGNSGAFDKSNPNVLYNLAFDEEAYTREANTERKRAQMEQLGEKTITGASADASMLQQAMKAGVDLTGDTEQAVQSLEDNGVIETNCD